MKNDFISLFSFCPILFLSSYRWWQLPYYWVGIKLYDLVAGSQCLKSSYVLSKSRALELFPMLRKDKLVGAIVYYDGKSSRYVTFSKAKQFASIQCPQSIPAWVQAMS